MASNSAKTLCQQSKRPNGDGPAGEADADPSAGDCPIRPLAGIRLLLGVLVAALLLLLLLCLLILVSSGLRKVDWAAP